MQCKFINPKTNIQCKAMATKDGYCFTHSPRYKEAKIEAVRRGGLNRKNIQCYGESVDLKTPKDITLFLGQVINGVWTGKIPAREPANTIGFLCRCFLDSYQLSEMDLKIKEIEERLLKGGL